MQQAFDGHLHEPAKQTEVFDAGNDSVKCDADVVFQVSQQFDANQLALGGLRPPFRPRTMFAKYNELIEGAPRLFSLQERYELAMNLEVRIPSDRGSEMTVVRARQGVVALLLGSVRRLFQAAQKTVVHCIFLGLAFRFPKNALELESTLRQLERES